MVQSWPSKSWPSDLEGCGTAMRTRHNIGSRLLERRRRVAENAGLENSWP